MKILTIKTEFYYILQVLGKLHIIFPEMAGLISVWPMFPFYTP